MIHLMNFQRRPFQLHKKMFFKPVLRYAPQERKLRLFRLVWQTGEWQNTSGCPPHSHKLSVSLRPRLFGWQRSFEDWRLVLCGLEVHRKWSWGGTFV